MALLGVNAKIFSPIAFQLATFGQVLVKMMYILLPNEFHKFSLISFIQEQVLFISLRGKKSKIYRLTYYKKWVKTPWTYTSNTVVIS